MRIVPAPIAVIVLAAVLVTAARRCPRRSGIAPPRRSPTLQDPLVQDGVARTVDAARRYRARHARRAAGGAGRARGGAPARRRRCGTSSSAPTPIPTGTCTDRIAPGSRRHGRRRRVRRGAVGGDRAHRRAARSASLTPLIGRPAVGDGERHRDRLARSDRRRHDLGGDLRVPTRPRLQRFIAPRYSRRHVAALPIPPVPLQPQGPAAAGREGRRL